MGSGPPFAYADATFSFTFRGDGRDDKYLYRPVSPQSFIAWAPPGALNAQSALYRTRIVIGSGGTQTILTGAQIATLTPWTASYVVLVPPVTSTVSKTMKGAGGDVGINLIPWLPNIIALPNPLPSSWALVYTMGAAEDLDLLLF